MVEIILGLLEMIIKLIVSGISVYGWRIMALIIAIFLVWAWGQDAGRDNLESKKIKDITLGDLPFLFLGIVFIGMFTLAVVSFFY